MRSPRGCGGGVRGQEQQQHVELIPGIPDDVAVDCLARVPHASHRALRRVCRGWRSAAAAPAFASARAAAGAAEDLVYLMQFGNPSADEGPKDEDDGPPAGAATPYAGESGAASAARRR